MENKYFIAVYTNEVKDYCDEQFFDRVRGIAGHDVPVLILDNTLAPSRYMNRIYDNTVVDKNYHNFYPSHIDVPELPKRTQFLRNVTESVQSLRKSFLESPANFQNFIIIESDVIPPVDLLDRFDRDIRLLNITDPKWGAIGGIYYEGFHDFLLGGLHKTHHVLSGCTLYKREMVEKIPFRWSEDNLGAFPDAWMSYDAGPAGFTLYNDHDIKCAHLENPKTKTRYTKPL